MGLLPSLAMLLILLTLPELHLAAQSVRDARALDALLQNYAYQAFVRPKTGVAYNGAVPSNLTGIEITVMRVRSGSLKKRGVSMYKEFKIPTDVVVSPYVERLVLVYQNLANWSTAYYPLSGYTYLAPVVGLLAYDASNLLATNLPELDVKATGNPITIHFSDVKSAPDGSVAKCVSFDLNGSVNFNNVGSGSVCSTFDQGHFALVAESIAPAPSPASPSPARGVKRKKSSKKVWIIVGSVFGGLLLLALLSFLVLWVRKFKQRKKMQEMEKAAEVGEALQMTSVGETRAPAAMVTRTQPTLENEYVA